MDRRDFLHSTAAALGTSVSALADAPMPMATLGKSGLRVSRFTLGGYHMAVKGEEEGVKIIRRAIDLGVVMFDSAAKYHQGKSDEVYGKALTGGLRKKVLLMSKAELRDKKSAMGQLEMTLKRMNTDYLDLWCCHEVARMDEVEKILAPAARSKRLSRPRRRAWCATSDSPAITTPRCIRRCSKGSTAGRRCSTR